MVKALIKTILIDTYLSSFSENNDPEQRQLLLQVRAFLISRRSPIKGIFAQEYDDWECEDVTLSKHKIYAWHTFCKL